MKLLISTIFVVFSLTNKLTAQNTSDKKNSMNIWLALPLLVSTSSADNDGLLFNPRFGIGKGKSMFYLGPTYSNSNGITGGNFVYQIYPNGLGRIFDLFFQGDLIIQKVHIIKMLHYTHIHTRTG